MGRNKGGSLFVRLSVCLLEIKKVDADDSDDDGDGDDGDS